MSLGYSHPINYELPDQVKVSVERHKCHHRGAGQAEGGHGRR